MEVNYMVLCCVLIVTTAFLSSVDAVPENINENPALDAEGKACDCGENSVCDFDEKRCYCIEGYSAKDGVCSRCDCGFSGNCKYENGKKKCECDEGYLELNGVCEECDCGDNGTCFFQNGEATCKCQPGFVAYDGICLPCDCGLNSEDCGFLLAEKQCKCKDGYADRSGTCEECYCGANSTFCTFKDNQKTCRCQEGYVQKGETCELGCSVQKPCQNEGHCKDGYCYCLNGTRGKFCEVIDECSHFCPKQNDIKCSYDARSQQAYCRCLFSYLIYDPKSRQCRIGCSVERPCQNGGSCKDNFCICPEGTRGELCEVIDECTNLCPDRSDVKCSYDIQSKKAYCKCLDTDLSYDSKLRQCRIGCSVQQPCHNGGHCKDGFCLCLTGTRGEICEVIDECSHFCPKQNDIKCSYDVRFQKAYCRCLDSHLIYDPKLRQCRIGCSVQQPCLNGGYCTIGGICSCLMGTRGEFCEMIDECSNLCPKQNDIKCSYDARSQQAYCRCLDSNLIYDHKLRQCRIGCSVLRPCQNGGSCNDPFCMCPEGTRGEFCEVIDDCTKVCPNRSDVKCSYDIQSKKIYCNCLDSDLIYDSKMRQCRKKCEDNNQCINGKCSNNVCDCIPGTSGDQCEIVDCKTDAINCRDGMKIFRRGEKIIFVLFMEALMKFERESSTILQSADCSQPQRSDCKHSYDFLWCGGLSLYVPTNPRSLTQYVLKYVRKNSDGSRCSPP